MIINVKIFLENEQFLTPAERESICDRVLNKVESFSGIPTDEISQINISILPNKNHAGFQVSKDVRK